MNRKKIYSLFLIVFFIATFYVVVWATTSTIEFVAEVVFPTFVEAKITHTPVNNVVPKQEFLNIEASVHFGDYIKAEKAELLYYFDNQKDNVYTVSKSEILHRTPFYIKTETANWKDDAETINYQIKVTLKKQGDDTPYYAYWPNQLTASSDTFHTATISKSTTTTIGSEGGTIEVENGNQETGNTGVVIEPGTVDPGTEITVGEISFDDLFGGLFFAKGVSLASSKTPLGVCVNIGYVLGKDVFNPPATMKISLGTETLAKKFVVKYMSKEDVAAKAFDKAVNVKIEKLDLNERLVYVKAAKEGYYLVIESTNLEDNDYRPEKRVRVKSRISSYGGFKFANLKEGDVVKIYNVNGKKIAELTSGTGAGFEWKGRKDTNNSGDWAESGTYIYQIKLKEKGKIISGTIAFVW